MTTTTKKQQYLTVLDYEVLSARRVIFDVLSSNGVARYKTTFDRKHGSSCTCPGKAQFGKVCYHLIMLAPVADTLLNAEEAKERAIYEQAFDPCGLFV